MHPELCRFAYITGASDLREKRTMRRAESSEKSFPGLWHMMCFFWPHVGSHRWLIAGSLAALLAEISLRLLEPWPLKFVFDYVLVVNRGQSPRFGGISLKDFDPAALLMFSAVAVILITGMRALADFLNTIGFSLLGNRALTEVRGEVYRHLQSLSLSFHTKARSGDLLVRVTGDINMLKDVAVTALVPMTVNFMVVFCMLGIMFW